MVGIHGIVDGHPLGSSSFSLKKISVKSHYIQYLIHPQYDHLLQVIFLVHITYPQFSVELGKFSTVRYLELRNLEPTARYLLPPSYPRYMS